MVVPSFWITMGPILAINSFVIACAIFFAFIYNRRPKTDEIEDRHSSIILNRWVREFWFWLTNPIFKFFIFFKISPNAISMTGGIVALFCAVAFIYGHFGLGGWLMVFGASLDLFDGRVARATNSSTLAGSYIDSTLDRISEGITLTGIAFFYRNSFVFWIVMLAYLGSQLTSYTKAKGETMGVEYAGGMMQRPERIAYLGAGGILTPVFAYILYPMILKKYPNLSYLAFESYIYMIPLSFVALFSTLTSINRIINVMKLLDKKQFGSKD